jgi:hypothetical protein
MLQTRRYYYDLRLSNGEFVPELGFERQLRLGDQFELWDACWRVTFVARALGGGADYEVEAELLGDGADPDSPADA